jgi:hypothetical protein
MWKSAFHYCNKMPEMINLRRGKVHFKVLAVSVHVGWFLWQRAQGEVISLPCVVKIKEKKKKG